MPQVEHKLNDAHHLCWSCREEVGEGPFCQNCIAIQPLDELGDYFSLFGIERRYRINTDYLKTKYYRLSRKFHPDFFGNKSSKELELARDNSAYLNTALKTLSDPILRAEYLLKLAGGGLSGEPTPPKELFDEILEVGELLIEGDPLSDNDRARLEKTWQNFKARQLKLIASLDDAFDRLLSGDLTVKTELESRLNNIRYLRTILGRIDNRLKKQGLK